jgi:hypothetical protein
VSGNRSRNKGSSFESAIERHLQASGHPAAHRTRTPGTAADRGDIGGLPVVVETKNCARMELGQWWTQASEAGVRCGLPAVVVHKRRGVTDPARQWVTMDLATLLRLLDAR